MFGHSGVWRKILPLSGAFISGFQPGVWNLSFSKIFEHASLDRIKTPF
ncbi:hypothetical protein GRAQ_00881 [Rahnella aquatilis CIP 78.65 = ATCC 33071]|nr:hypothetical protein GRAQ_00881 [Rahnella aquatilis CIP 78.65 = ATCC 33071]